jgi:hypothetical protein
MAARQGRQRAAELDPTYGRGNITPVAECNIYSMVGLDETNPNSGIALSTKPSPTSILILHLSLPYFAAFARLILAHQCFTGRTAAYCTTRWLS